MSNPFNIIEQWLSKNELTATEKRQMRAALLSYVTTHPVKSGLLSPYTFRYATVALASLFVVLGGSIGLTQAAKGSLPNDRLYPVKIWVEEFQAKNQKTPEAVIAYESKRIETRFNEARSLAIKQELNDATSSIIQSGLEHSRSVVKEAADTIQHENPELALAATNRLETSFSSNGKILASIERNTGQNIGTIVLAAQVTTEKLASEKVKFEQIVALKPNTATQASAEAKISELRKVLATLPAPETTVTTLTADATAPATATLAVARTAPIAPVAAKMLASEPTTLSVSTTATGASSTPVETPWTLVESAQKKIDAGQYSEALVLLQKASQMIDEDTMTKTLEETYHLKTDTTTSSEPQAQ